MCSKVTVMSLAISLFSIFTCSEGYGSYLGILPYLSIHGIVPETERVPKFLKESQASQKTIDDYHNLISRNSDVNEKRLDAKVQDWVDVQDIVIQKNYAYRMTYIPEKITKTKEAHKKAIENFSTEAKKSDFELTQIYNNQDLSVAEKREKIQKILKILDENVRNELQNEHKI